MNKAKLRNGQAALAYAEKFGWLILPLHSMALSVCSCGKKDCKSSGKHPRVRNGVKDSTTDTSRIKNWWDSWPEANVGIATGKKSGIIVIDVDKHGDVNGLESLRAKEAEIGKLPDTVTQQTGGGGIQLFFKYPGQKVKNGVHILPGVDIRSDDGYVVVPPSNHKSGGTYAWKAGHKPGEKELAELPQPWVDLLTGSTKRTTFKAPEVIKHGTRNAFAFSLACSLNSKNISIEAATEAILLEIKTKAEDLEDYDEAEIIRTIQSAYSKPPGINQKEDPEEAEFNKAFQWTDYRVRNGHLRLITERNSDGPVKDKELANFVPLPYEEITRDDGITQEKYFVIGARLYDGRMLPKVVVPTSKFNAMNWFTDSWGFAAITASGSNTKEHLRIATQHLAKGKATASTVYTHMGWRKINGEWIYLYRGGAIGADNVRVELEEALSGYGFPRPVQDYREAARISFKTLSIASLEITMPLLAMAYLSPLNEFFRQAGHEPAFIIWLTGKSGAKKSSVAAAFLNHFGAAFEYANLPASFTGSYNSIEKLGFTVKDGLLVIDDFHPVGSMRKKQEMLETAQAIMRGFGDRRGRTRLTNDMRLREPFIPRGNAIVTGEDLPNIGQSGTARYLAIEIQRIDITTLSYVQANKDMLALSMRGYIEWLKTNYIDGYSMNNDVPGTKTFPDFLRVQYTNSQQALANSTYHGRMPGIKIWLYIAWQMLLGYFQDVGVINEETRNNYLDMGVEVLNKVIQDQDTATKEDGPANKFLIALEELISRQVYALPSADTTKPDIGDGRPLLGFYDKDYYYLYPGFAYNAVCQFYQQRGESFPVSQDTLFKHLEAEGHIETGSDGTQHRRTKQKRINDANLKWLWLKASSLTYSV